MKDQIVDFLINNPIAWIAVLLLAPIAIGYRYRKFMRATQGSKDTKSKSLLVVGFVATAIILWAVVQYT